MDNDNFNNLNSSHCVKGERGDEECRGVQKGMKCVEWYELVMRGGEGCIWVHRGGKG